MILSTQAGQTKSDLRIPLSILHRIKRLIALRSGRKSAFSSRPSFALLQFQQKSKQRAASNSSEQKPALSFFLSLPLSVPASFLILPSPPPPFLQADILGKLGFFVVSGIFRLSPRYIRVRHTISHAVCCNVLNSDKWAMQCNFSQVLDAYVYTFCVHAYARKAAV